MIMVEVNIMPKNKKETKILLKEAKQKRDEALKEAERVRTDVSITAYGVYHSKTKGRLEDSYRAWTDRLPNPYEHDEMKSRKEWDEINILEKAYLKTQKEVNQIEPEARAVKNKLQSEAKEAFEDAAIEIEEKYEKRVRIIKGGF